ncbi:MAG: glucose-6-phosphate dehydrogenase [Candidatus Rifleibacteriota bacterium]
MFFCASSIVIFGGTGDLSLRKLIPALCRLESAGLLVRDFHVYVTGRSKMSSAEFIEKFTAKAGLEKDAVLKDGFAKLKNRIIYVTADPQAENEEKNFYQRLNQVETQAAPARLFYLAVPPESMESFIKLIKPFSDNNLNSQCPIRVLVEKPFGHNLESSIELNKRLLETFREDQILRIDHYLGKEAVQNILFMRFANIFFEPVWNNHFIDNVQISFAEKIGIGSRAGYFDQTGILRDVVQNHLLQVLCMVAMEPPLSNRPADLHLEKNKVLKAIRRYSADEVANETVRGQYVADPDKSIAGYLQEAGVRPDSKTETFAAARLFIENWRWSGVPFYLRAGKRLSKSLTEICISFKALPHSIFKDLGSEITPNRLFIRIQPDEGITMKLNSKPPGMHMKVTDVGLKFSYEAEFGSYRPDAYERLLLDALKADSSLFLSSNEIAEAWKFIDPIIDAWHSTGAQPMFVYKANSAGPQEADDLLAKHGHRWYPSESGENDND